MKMMVVVLAAALAACSTFAPKPPKTLACQQAAQWFTNDDKGVPTAAVMVCFAADGSLRWQRRAITLDELEKLTAPANTGAAAAAPKPKYSGQMPDYTKKSKGANK